MRLWACAGSALLNLAAFILLPFFPETMPWFFVPGLIPIVFLTGGWFASLSFTGNLILVLVNFGTYYFLFLWIIGACQPATSWWPTKPS
jgi:hypothetical protein